ncbi:NADH-quinone oxidoreductase subunit A [Mucilaginibacter boryungensis]
MLESFFYKRYITIFAPMEAQSSAINYLPIVIQMLVAVGFAVGTMFATHYLGPKRKTKDKLTPFESGVEVVGNARTPISIKYFLVAILFVLFDVEVIFMYPWAVNFREMGVEGLVEMFIFMATLLLGFIYILKKKALDWD